MVAARKLERALTPRPDERGMVLVVALLVMVILALLGVTFLTISASEYNIASNELNASRAFNLAEAGAEHARAELRGADINSILTQGGNINFAGYGTAVSFAGGSYSVSIRNNTTAMGAFPVDPGGPTNDTDERVILTATGTFKNAQKVIESLASIPKLPPPPGAVAAFSQDSEVEAGGDAEINGNNFDPPPYPCSGAGCDGLPNSSVPAVPGVLFNSTGATAQGIGSATIEGNPPTRTDVSASATPWINLASSLAPCGNIALTVPTTFASNQVWGSPSSPAVVRLTGPVTINGNVNGAGILIVENQLTITGTFHFQGIVLIMSTGVVEVSATGDSSIYGTTIIYSTDSLAELRLRLRGHTRLRYSKLAVDRVALIMPTQVLTWREVPN